MVCFGGGGVIMEKLRTASKYNNLRIEAELNHLSLIMLATACTLHFEPICSVLICIFIRFCLMRTTLFLKWRNCIVFTSFSPGYIDLSKRRVSPEEAIKCEDKFTKSKTVSQCFYDDIFKPCVSVCTQLILCCCVCVCVQVYSILRHVAEVLEYSKDEQLESLYQRTAWVFDEKYKRPGYGAYDVFKQAVS